MTVIRILALILVIGLSIFIFLVRDRAEEFRYYGYPGIFLLSFLAYATVLLPAPGVMIVFTMGGVFNPIGVALAAGTGAALGELSGYLAGFSGQPVAERAAVYEKFMKWMEDHRRFAPALVLLLSAIPNPFFDLAGAAAGVLKMPVPQFLWWCWIGETLKMLVFAYAGANGINLLNGWMS